MLELASQIDVILLDLQDLTFATSAKLAFIVYVYPQRRNNPALWFKTVLQWVKWVTWFEDEQYMQNDNMGDDFRGNSPEMLSKLYSDIVFSKIVFGLSFV